MLFVALLAGLSLTQPTTWTLGVGGDIMLNGISTKKNPLASIATRVSNCSVFIANQEIPLTDKKVSTTRKSAEDVKARRQFILKADPAHVANLKSTGVDIVSLGNNHCMDYGPDGLAQMIGYLDKNGIRHAGAGSNEGAAWTPATFPKPYLPNLAFTSMLGFISDKALNTCWPATENSAGLAALRLGGVINEDAKAKIQAIVERAKLSGDFVIVAIHWGIERETTPTSYQVAVGRAFIDAGADVVLGHHPHVLQGAEIYDGKPIFYSLGNLISAMPASTAIFRLTYLGEKLRALDIAPCSIAEGAVSPVADKQVDAQLKRFGQLCDAVQKKYANKKSKKPSVGLWKDVIQPRKLISGRASER